jgi:hypothetical protein
VGAGVRRRFLLEESEIADLSAGNDHTCQLQYLVYDAQVLFDFGVERGQDYELVKIAEVMRSADGKGIDREVQTVSTGFLSSKVEGAAPGNGDHHADAA